MDQAMTCIIENGTIYKIEYGNKVIVGVVAEAYTNLKDLSEKAVLRNDELAKEKDKYYKMLVDNGIITEPKTTEELIQETQKQQKSIIETLNNLTDVLDKLNERMGVVENELTRNNANGEQNGNKPRKDKPSVVDDK